MNDWLKNSVIYQIYPQSFYDTDSNGIGDLNGIIEKLPYIKSLGVNVIWLNPIYCSAFMDAGYDVTDFYKVDNRYGNNQDLANLVEKCHEQGIKLVLDLVAGHTSDQHPWFIESKKAEKNQYTNRYIWTDAEFKQINGLRTMHGMSDRCGAYAVNFFNHQPALNYGFAKITESWQLPVNHPDCLKMREELKNIMSFWFDMGVDGFRVDMASSLIKDDEGSVETIKLWQDIRKWLNKKYPNNVLISEWSQPDRAIKAGFDVDFYIFFNVIGYNALFNNKEKSFFNALGEGDVMIFTNEYCDLLEKTIDYGYMSIPTGNHDISRISYNRTDRQIRLVYSFIFTMPGVPAIYYGDEIGMKYQDKLSSKEGGYGRTGSRTPMQWDDTTNAGFSNASPSELYLPIDQENKNINVKNQELNEDSLLNFTKKLIKLRQEYKALSNEGSFVPVYAKKNKYPFVYKRVGLDETFYIIVNPKNQEIKLSHCDIPNGKIMLSVGQEPKFAKDSITVFAESFTLIRLNKE